MAGNNSEYQAEYCGYGGSVPGSSSGPGIGEGSGYKPCSKSYDVQPVGGKMQETARKQALAEQAMGYIPAQQRGCHGQAMQNSTGLPACDENFVATVYSDTERGTHRVQPQWIDPRWTPEKRIGTSTLYERSERDPPHRQNFYVYRSTLVDAASTPCEALTVPDVHSLRYMHNNYMSPDDWY